MPQATFKSVYAVSSEDPAHPASNLLKIQSGKKWKTQNVGEKTAYVILQFDELHRITGIDIGNEHSAFVEVLVGKPGWNHDDFKEILMMCSFMTPIESKNSTNLNRVRCFAQNALVESIAEQKWDLIKVVCTQPFNKHVQYGLSFIKIHVADLSDKHKEKKPLAPPQFLQQKQTVSKTSENNSDEPKKIGKFVLREDSPDSESETSTGLFNRWKQNRHSPGNKPLSAAAAIREASSPAALKTHTQSFKQIKIIKKQTEDKSSERKSLDKDDVLIRDRNRNDLIFGNEDEAPNEQLERRISADHDRRNRENDKNSKHERKPHHTTKTSDTSSNKYTKPINGDDAPSPKPKPKIRPITTTYPSTSSHKRSVSPDQSPSNSAKKMKPNKRTEYRPFNELLKGVVLVISGIQNPDRGELRRKALEMGAKYKPDWDSTCSHLICAFKNTPKYNQVRGKGKIIGKQWIEKCYSLKKRLPWRRYALDDDEAKKIESEDEIHDISIRPESPEPVITTKQSSPPDRNISPISPDVSKKHDGDDMLALYDLDDDDVQVVSNKQQILDVTSGSDTEEEIERIRKVQQEKMTPSSKHINEEKSTDSKQKKSIKKEPTVKIENSERIYDATTEEDEFTSVNKDNWSSSKNFFAPYKFYINDNLGSLDQVKIKHQIKTYGGAIVKSAEDAQYIITKEAIRTPSDSKSEMVKPLWIYECNDMEGLVPTTRYKV